MSVVLIALASSAAVLAMSGGCGSPGVYDVFEFGAVDDGTADDTKVLHTTEFFSKTTLSSTFGLS